MGVSAMKTPIFYRCAECDAEEPKIVTLFMREHYCGRFCLAEGQLKHARLIIRVAEEGIYGDECVS